MIETLIIGIAVFLVLLFMAYGYVWSNMKTREQEERERRYKEMWNRVLKETDLRA